MMTNSQQPQGYDYQQQQQQPPQQQPVPPQGYAPYGAAPTPVNMPGSVLLMISGILYILWAALMVFIGVIFMVGGTALVGSMRGRADVEQIARLLGAFAGPLGGVLILVAGLFITFAVLAIRWRNLPHRALALMIIGAVLLGLSLLTGRGDLLSVGGLLGLAAPVLYFVGGLLNVQANKNRPVA